MRIHLLLLSVLALAVGCTDSNPDLLQDDAQVAQDAAASGDGEVSGSDAQVERDGAATDDAATDDAGAPVDEGVSVPDAGACSDGDTRTVACGLNDAGEQRERCGGGEWNVVGRCDDPDECTNGEDETRACPEGAPAERRCDDGRWGDWSVCDAPLCATGAEVRVLQDLNQTVSVDTRMGQDQARGTCAGRSGGAPEVVLAFHLDEDTAVRIWTEVEDSDLYDPLMYLRTSCRDPDSEVGCDDDGAGARNALLQGVLPPGDYYLFVDGYEGEGLVDVIFETAALEACDEAGELRSEPCGDDGVRVSRCDGQIWLRSDYCMESGYGDDDCGDIYGCVDDCPDVWDREACKAACISSGDEQAQALADSLSECLEEWGCNQSFGCPLCAGERTLCSADR